MAVPKRKQSNSRTGMRRSHHGLKAKQLQACAKCGTPFAVTRPHARFCSPRCRVAANRDTRNSQETPQQANVVPLRASQAEPVVTRPPLVRPVCSFCHWRAALAVPAGEISHCEACGLGAVAIEDGQ